MIAERFVQIVLLARKDNMGADVGHKRSWWSTLAICCLVFVFVFAVVGPGGISVARAADEGAQAEEPEEPNLLVHIISSAGIVFGPLLLGVSIALVTLIVLLAMDLRLSSAVPPDFVEEFTDTVNKRQFKQAFEMAKTDTSFLARVLTAGMGRLQYGIEDARDASLNMTESVRSGKASLLNYLATIGTLGPMLGLVGTVFGMIQSFMVLAVPGSTPKASDLAKGISHALVVTLLGIALAVPAIFFHAMFTNRLTRIALDASNLADDLLTQMYHNSKKPAVAETVKPPSTANVDVRGTPAAKPATATVEVRSAVKPAE
jgi:biopolymer transport protein ExbB